MAAPLVRLWYRTPNPLAPGHFIQSKRGRVAYEVVDIVAAEPMMLGGDRWIKWTIRCRRWSPSDVPPGATLHTMLWDKRGSRR